MSEGTEKLTSDEIVALLKSNKGEDRSKAIEALYPGETVLLSWATSTGQLGMINTPGVNVAILYTLSMWMAQHWGNQMGMALAWVPDKNAQQGKLVVPGSGQMPMMK